ncbi:hypothetical protein FQN57_005571 [Myotisia sp. PD_48]|nr:hypothetical protein FQN57_005571 [Myotisia sp. PD_48]
MSRSAADATRFTATGPYASSKSSSQTKWADSTVRSSQPPHGQETAKEKVERLRAQARANRIAKSLSPVDRLINSGRSWADRLHRIAVFSFLTASGIAGALTIYSMTSVVLHNRRQQVLWIDKQLELLVEAKKAYVAGTATSEQLRMLEKEKLAELDKQRRDELKKQTTLYKARSWLFGAGESEKSDNASKLPETPLESTHSPTLSSSSSTSSPSFPSSPSSSSPILSQLPNDAIKVNSESKTTDSQDTGSNQGWVKWIKGK